MSTVIKAGQAGSILKRLSHVDLADHLSEAQAVIAEAKRRATQMVAQANEESARIRQAAHEEGQRKGYEQGYREGEEAGRRDALAIAAQKFDDAHSAAVAAIEAAVDDIESLKGDLTIRAERDVLDLAIRIAEKMTYAVGRMNSESAKVNLARALRLVGSQTDVTVYAHPDDIATLKAFAPSVLEKAGQAQSVKIASDKSVSPGGCRVTYGQFEIDNTLETQIAEMVSLLTGQCDGV